MGRGCWAALVGVVVSGCGTDERGELSVGLTTDLALGFDARSVDVEVEVDGEIVARDTFESDRGGLPAIVAPVPVDVDSLVGVRVTARDAAGAPVVTRLAETSLASPGAWFLPLSVDRACLGIACGPGETCASGACVAPLVDGAALDALDPSWLVEAPDACRAGEGEAWLELGVGESSFAELGVDEEVTLEPGPQGGHHVWLALRAYGVRQSGSVVTVQGELPSLGRQIPELVTSVSLRRAEAGACQLWGLRFQVDRGVTLDEVLGEKLRVKVRIEDDAGGNAAASREVRISPSIGGA
jgi:hypothetical protein